MNKDELTPEEEKEVDEVMELFQAELDAANEKTLKVLLAHTEKRNVD